MHELAETGDVGVTVSEDAVVLLCTATASWCGWEVGDCVLQVNGHLVGSLGDWVRESADAVRLHRTYGLPLVFAVRRDTQPRPQPPRAAEPWRPGPATTLVAESRGVRFLCASPPAAADGTLGCGPAGTPLALYEAQLSALFRRLAERVRASGSERVRTQSAALDAIFSELRGQLLAIARAHTPGEAPRPPCQRQADAYRQEGEEEEEEDEALLLWKAARAFAVARRRLRDELGIHLGRADRRHLAKRKEEE